ncbi:MAG TPA: gliding motility-associated C-terminal domain-containing protein [Chryseosolibacter sp.]
MRRILTLAVLLVASHYAFSQTEICNNGLDDDFDGFIDCYDGSCANNPVCDGFLGNDAACEAVPPQFPQFTMALDFASPDETTNHLSRLAIGDLDRDGIPEMVTMNRYTKKIFILNGNNGTVKREATVTWEPYWEIAIANIDNDNCGEIYFIGQQDPPGNNNSGVYIFAYDCQLNKLWETAQRLPGDPINFGLADFDGDGQVELYAKDEIYDAKTGVRIVKSTASSYTRQNGGPVAANILGDDKLELISGLRIYQVNLGARTLDAGSLTLLQSRSEYFIRNEYNATSIADYNQDGFLDVLASGSTNSNGDNTTVFFWDVQNNSIRTYSDPQPALGTNYEDGWINGTGRLNIADLDGNGRMNASFVSGRFLYALDENFSLLWRVNINEETSGHTGCTLFDFNGDGKAEIVYRDERFIYIIEGTDGSIYSQQACISRTNREYPIVADVDADGSTELCVPCGFNDTNSANNFNNLNYSRYSHIRVFKSAAEPWVPARRVWNQHGYFVVNVNDDLTIPRKLQAHQVVFSTGNCTQGPNRPLNKFLNQSPYLNSEGCPTYAAPDIAFQVAPTIIPPTCPNLNFQVSFKITNLGDVAVTGNIPVSFYASNPMQAGAAKLATINIPVNGLANGDIVSVDNQTVTGNGSEFVYVVLNDAGTSLPTPIVLPNTNFIECDYDNIRFARIDPLPVAITGVAVSDSETCTSTANGVARAFIPTNGGENTADYNFYWSNGTTAKPIASADFIGPIYSGLAPGTYTVYARHKTANCNSDTTQVVIGSTTVPFPPITINVLSDQTSCSPFNGRLEAVIQGGGAGYTIDWYDIALNSLGISGPIASNLQAGSYLAVITRGTCNTSVPATVNPPTVPDAQASVVQHVLDCANPNSGSITADALVSGVVQNPANYTFTWYRYDMTNNVRGSVLPAIHGAGKTRTGLPVGYYQVEVRENASQCPSTITPIVQVEARQVTPDPPQIVILSSQTSCDPLQPNGVMTANVTVGGVPQNPADFTFEWFKGQNTLPANLQTDVSDVNGKTVNKVAAGGIPYTVRVTNAFNCSATADMPITETIIAPVVTLAQLTPNTVCDPAKATTPYNGSLQATVTFNGNPVSLPDNNYTFEWRNPSNAVIPVADNRNPILTGLQDGNAYSVTVRRVDLACVSAPDTEPVQRTTVLPQLATTSTGSNTCDAAATPDGTATVTVTNAIGADVFTFRWHAGNTVVPANVLSASNNFDQATAIRLGGVTGSPNPYTVLVTNTRTGCENTATQFVADESVIPVISFLNVTANTKCVAPFDGGLAAQITNQIGPITNYNFDWFNGNSNASPIINGVDGATLASRDVGFYTVEVENTVTGCRSTAITNQVPDGRVFPAISFTSVGSQNCDPSLTPRGSITANVTNGGTTFSYAWTAVAPAPAVNASNNFTAQTLINVGGPTGGLPPRSYDVLVTNTVTGCANTSRGQVADLSQKPTLTLMSNPNSVCDVTIPGGPTTFNGSLTVTAVNHPALGSSPINYAWFDANAAGTVTGAHVPSPNNPTLSQLPSAKYGVQVTVASLGCVSDIVVDEVLDTTPVVDIQFAVTPQTNCAPAVDNGALQVTSPVGASIQYQWHTGTTLGAPIGGATNATLSGRPGGVGSNFTVLVTNLANGCQYNEAANVPDGRVTPTLSLSVVQHNTVCDIANIAPTGALAANVVNAGANFSVLWTDGVPGAPNPLFSGLNATQLEPGSYSAIVVNNDTQCQSAADSEVILNNVVYPNIQALVGPQTSCNVGTPNGSIIATDGGVTAGRTFEWFTGVGPVAANALTTGPNTITNLVSGDYTLQLTIDATGCSAVRSDFVNEQITLPAINFAAIGPVTRCDFPDGSVTPAVTNASANFSISYVFTAVDGTPPTTSAAVIGAPTIPVRNDLSPYAGLEPGFVTAVVVNNTTQCVSNPFTGNIPNATATYNITITGTSPATACGDPNGGVNITVAGGSGSYDFSWHRDSPTNTDINFFNNPPSFVGNPFPASIAASEDLGVSASPPDPSITTGTYTVVVTDQTNGCGNYFVTNVPFADAPDIAVASTPNTDCVTPDGSINVTVTPGPINVSGYSILVFRGTSPVTPAVAPGVVRGEIDFDGIDNDGDLQDEGTDPDAIGNTLSVPGLAEGEYFVQIIDNDLLNRPCPLSRVVRINKVVANPIVSVTGLIGNQSCDPLTVAEGEVQLTVTTATGDVQAKDYYLNDISPLPQGFLLPGAPGLQIGNGQSGQNTGFIPGFRPTTYTFRVLDNESGCFTDLTINVPNQPDLPGNLLVNPTPETACAPGTNGAAEARLESGQDEDEFQFTWFENNDGTGSVYSAIGASGIPTNGELLNASKAPGNWFINPVAGFGSGDRIYYVQAVKNANAPSGFGCATPIRQVVIQDAHVSPQLALTPSTNSFCTAPNAGDLGDGSIAVTVDADPSTAGIQVSTYNYTWTTPNAGLAMPQNGVPNTLTIPQLGNGSYTVNAVNTANGCITTSTATITPEPFTINLTTTKVDQLICNPDGRIDVTQIVIDRPAPKTDVTNLAALPLTNVYAFEWFAADPNDPNVIINAPLQDGAFNNIIGQSLVSGNGAGQLQNMGAGTYYIRATRRVGSGVAEGCEALPVRIDINDLHTNPLVNLTPFSNTSCLNGAGTGEGIIEIRVTDPTPLSYNGNVAFSYDYDWTLSPVLSPIADAPTNDGDGSAADGDDDRVTNLLEGNYGLTVTNPASGCFSTSTTTINKNATPIFVQNVVKADQISCDPDGDGSLNVTRVTLNDRQGTVETFDATGTASPISDFEFTWTRPSIGQQTTTGTLLDVVTYNRVANFGNTPIGAGTYTVVATRVVAPGPDDVGRGCSSAPFTISIQDKRRFPVVSLTPFANTACDPAFSEGSIEVRVSDATLVAGPHTFSYAWNGGNPTLIAASGANNGDGLATGDNDVPTGLFHGVYNMTVTNNQSQCQSPASTELFRNSTPIIIPEAVATPQVLCSADGTIRVSSVEVTDRNNNTFTAPFADFDFNWTPASGGPSVVTDGALGAVPGGTIVDRTVYPTIQRGQYFVTATRVAGTLGRGCVSAPYHVTIDDNRVFPEVTFTQRANSSCTDLAPNGTIIANAREISGVNTGPYTFAWAMVAPDVISPASLATNTANRSTLTNALDGNYLLTATNNVTSCPVTSPVTLVLDQSLSTPNIIEVTTVDPLDCNPTGQAAVTRITLGSTTSSILFPPNVPPNNEVSGPALANFQYEWYQGSVGSGNQLPIGGPFTTTPSINSLLTGTYYVVVRDPATDCRSGARELVITPDDIILPDLLLTQTALQISCRPGIGSAELTVTADGQTDANPNYTFTWFGNDSATPPSIGNASTLSDILAGTYSVTVHNNVTNCSISDSYIVEDDTQDFTPVLSTASQPRTLCVGTDGEVSVRILNLSPLYPYVPYTAATFTADLYLGASPNLQAPPDMPALPNTVGFIGNFTQNNLNEGFYTIRVTDNNTGCFSVATEQIKDARQYPVVTIDQIAPVTNCDPARPNGVAQVTANNTFVGYTFDWYEGGTATGTPVYSGAEFGELKVTPQQYTVRATNINSGCFTDANTQIENGTVPIPAATIEVLSHVTSCIEDNGSLMAYVGADKNTANYIFHWYDGTVENPPADNVGETYNDLPVGDYSVTATSIITGCKSPLSTEEIVNEQVFPNFDFIIQNTTCDQNDGFATMILLSDAPIERIEWINLADNSQVSVGPNFTNAAAGFYEITATTFLGCATTKQIEIKPDIRPYNGISRNNDGRNEHFQIDCIHNFPANNVKIFNRAGTLVYEGDSYDNANTVFDGRSNRGISPMGVNLPDGTYYYIVDKRDGTKPIAGYLEIVQ